MYFKVQKLKSTTHPRVIDLKRSSDGLCRQLLFEFDEFIIIHTGKCQFLKLQNICQDCGRLSSVVNRLLPPLALEFYCMK